jgi:hypothetical protein
LSALTIENKKKNNKAVKLHRSAKKPATQTKWKRTIHVCNKFCGDECWNKNKTNGKQQGQANKAFNRQTKPLKQNLQQATKRTYLFNCGNK